MENVTFSRGSNIDWAPVHGLEESLGIVLLGFCRDDLSEEVRDGITDAEWETIRRLFNKRFDASTLLGELEDIAREVTGARAAVK